MSDRSLLHRPLPVPIARLVLLAGLGFALAKALVHFDLIARGRGEGLAATVALSLATDGAVLLWLLVLGLLVTRRERPTHLVVWGLPALGLLLGAYAMLNVFFVLEVGTPLTFDLLAVDAGTGEAAAMLQSTAARLTLGGLLAYLVVAVPLVRVVEAAFARRWLGITRLIALYSATAMLIAVSSPRAASVHGLHRNAVSVFLLSLREDAAGLAMANTAAPAARPQTYTAPEGDHWTRPVSWERGARPRHVVLWLAESTGFRYTTLHDRTVDTTPTLTRLKGQSLWFTSYYANAPLSAQAIFGILCGMYPHPTGAPMSQANPRIACPSLMETLTDRGYHAGLFTGALFGFGDKQKFLVERGFDILIDGETVTDRGKYWSDGWGIEDAAIVDEALRWLDRRPDPAQPTLTVMIPIIPHAPYGLPPTAETPFGTDTRLGQYQNGLRYADAQFARFYDAYVERGLADDTLFIYVGDHGEAFEQHPGNRNHASFMYDENLHVPLLFINPRLFPSEVVSHRLGSHVDLLPTILELIRQEVPSGGQGQSLVSEAYQYRPVFMGSYINGHRGGLRDGRYKYIHHYNTNLDEVYDLSRDPLEQHNLVDTFDPEQVASWRRWVLDYHASQRVFLMEHETLGETYLQRILPTLAVGLEREGRRVPCLPKGPRDKAIACPGQPDALDVSLSNEYLKGVRRECLRVHPPEHGELVVTFTDIQPPSFLGAGLLDAERKKGGAPVEVAWTLGDAEPIVQILGDDEEAAYQLQRLPVTDEQEPVDVHVAIRSGDWTNRGACIVLAP